MSVFKNLLCAMLVAAPAIFYAQPPAGKALKGDHYGAKPDPSKPSEAVSLLKVFAAPDTMPVKVRARVTDVCSAKGCWARLRVNDSTEAFVKMKDYDFFVPLALKGKYVVLEGISFLKVTSVEDQKHYAEDAGRSKKEIDAITSPKKEIRLIASGIVVVD